MRHVVLWAAFAAFCLMACQPPHREYSPSAPSAGEAPAAGLPSKAGYVAEPEHSASKCPPPPVCESDPYEMCVIRDCEAHGCQLGWAAPEVAHRCGLVWCMSDGLEHAQCPMVGGVQTELRVCGGAEPPNQACFRFGSPLIDESSNAYCCTPDGSPLPAASCTEATVDTDCADVMRECQYAQCLEGRCYVGLISDYNVACGLNGSGWCWDGACQMAAAE